MATSDEIAFLDATSQAQLIRQKELTASALLEAVIRRIEDINPRINALVTPMYDEARASAKTVQADAVFAGVPFVLKDLIAEYAGARMTSGSAFQETFVSTHDSTLVARL